MDAAATRDAGRGSFQGFVEKISRGEKALLQEKPQRQMEWKEGAGSPRKALEIFLAGGFEGGGRFGMLPVPGTWCQGVTSGGTEGAQCLSLTFLHAHVPSAA